MLYFIIVCYVPGDALVPTAFLQLLLLAGWIFCFFVSFLRELSRCGFPSNASHIHVIQSSPSSDPLIISMSICGIIVEFEVDTGSGVSVMSFNQFRALFPNNVISRSSTTLSAVSGPVQVVGETFVDNHVHKLCLILCSGVQIQYPLLGRSWLDLVFPSWRQVLGSLHKQQINHVSPIIAPSVEELQSLFPKVFSADANSCIQGFTARLVLKPDAKPVKHGAYSIAFGDIPPVNNILDSWVDSGTAVRVRQAEWASPGMPLPKKDGTIRYVVDFKTTLNPQLRTDHYPLPRPDHVFASLSKGVFFTSLDLKDAYTQLKLHPDSQDLCIVNTHRGYYKLTRLIYGISSAAAIFQNVMDDILRDIPGVICYIDNILINGADLNEGITRTLLVLGRLEKHNVHLKLSKCEWFVTNLEFLGFVISKGRRGQAPSLTAAITNFKTPVNSSEVSSFLSLLSFYGMFIPMYSTVAKPLRLLTTNDAPFNWTTECQNAFQVLKCLLVSNDLLMLFDPDLPIVVYSDASPVGVGAVLAHTIQVNGKPVDKPVMFAAASLTKTQQNYAQVDREGLAVIFAVTKFHRFIWGRPFTLISDNFAVHRIFHETKGLPARTGHRLQHWATMLQAYNYKFIHRKCEFLQAADALSRLPSKQIIEEVYHVKVITPVPLTAAQIAFATAKDPILSRVLLQCHLGWPVKLNHAANSELSPFFKLRDQLTIIDKCLFFASRIVVPTSLQAQVLKLLHEGHPGIVRSKALARSIVWWPSLNQDIVTLCNNCTPCTVVNLKRTKEYIPWPPATSPFQRVHIDFFDYKNLSFLLICDAYSRWLQIVPMQSTTAESVIAQLLNVFAIFGLPRVLVSDNGPPFDSNEYAAFGTMYNIQILHSPIYHPESNGLAEKGVDIGKSGLKKMLDQNVSLNSPPSPAESSKIVSHTLQKFLFNYRNTPTAVTLKTPNELLFSFKPTTLLSHLLPPSVSKSQNKFHFREGEIVFVKLTKRTPAVKGTIVSAKSADIYIVSVEGVLKEIHHNQLVRGTKL